MSDPRIQMDTKPTTSRTDEVMGVEITIRAAFPQMRPPGREPIDPEGLSTYVGLRSRSSIRRELGIAFREYVDGTINVG